MHFYLHFVDDPGTPSKTWTFDEHMEVDLPVYTGGIVYPGVKDSQPVLTCHVITPDGADLVIKSDMIYPFITRINAHDPNQCSVTININAYTLGDWVIFGRFYSNSTQHEVRLPMSFYIPSKFLINIFYINKILIVLFKVIVIFRRIIL